MKKSIFLLVLLCISPWLTAQDVFQQSLFAADFILKHKETISLSTRQEGRIQTIHNENQSLFTSKRTELNQATERLRVLLNEESTNTSGVNTQMDKVLSLENELKKMQLHTLLALRNELNRNQVDGLKSLRQGENAAGIVAIQGKEMVFIRSEGTASENAPAYYIEHQGKMHKIKNIESIQPTEIQSISVLKGEAAIEQFGNEGRNGVIVITLKNATSIDIEKLKDNE